MLLFVLVLITVMAKAIFMCSFLFISLSVCACLCFGLVLLLIWNICREQYDFFVGSTGDVAFLMCWFSDGNVEVKKASSYSQAASSYRLSSPGADTDTALIIQTSVRRQKRDWGEIFFGSRSHCLPCTQQLSFSVRPSPFRNHCFIFSPTDVSSTHLSAQTFDNFFFSCRSWPENKCPPPTPPPHALLRLSTFLGILNNVCVCILWYLKPSVNK